MEVSARILVFLCMSTVGLHAQDGKILTKEPLQLTDALKHKIDSADHELFVALQEVNLYKITYFSDGLKVIGFMAAPKKAGSYPCLIANRGGRWNFSLWKPYWVAVMLGRMASWGYVVVASQYRGSADGSEGKDEFGGKDVNDVLNLAKVLANTTSADTSRIGMYGESRGGMMTYLSMRRSCQFKAAAVVGGVSDSFEVIRRRPELEELTYGSIPGYKENKEQILKARSSVYWAGEMCKSTQLLLLHGGADDRVDPAQSRRLADELTRLGHPVSLEIFEGAGHTLQEKESEMFDACRKHFDRYVRN